MTKNPQRLAAAAALWTLVFLAPTQAHGATLSTDGSSAGLRVVSSTDQRLTDIALPLLQAQRWKAARVRSTPVEVPLHVTVEFSIYGD